MPRYLYFDSGAAPLPKQTNRSRRKRWIPLEKSVVRVLLSYIVLRKFVGKIVFAKRLVPVLIWRLVGAGGASVWRIVLRLTYLSYRSCTIHRNAVCMWACMCNCVGVSVSRKKNFPISDAHFGERSCSNPPFFCMLIFADGIVWQTGCTRAITNDQAYTDDEQKHWFDKNDYRWLRERGVCTRPALGIYIETNPISHYVLDLSLPVNSQFMLVISRCIYILLNPRKKRPVT